MLTVCEVFSELAAADAVTGIVISTEALIATAEIKDTVCGLLAYIKEKHFDISARIASTGDLSDDDRAEIIAAAKQYLQER